MFIVNIIITSSSSNDDVYDEHVEDKEEEVNTKKVGSVSLLQGI
jgi:hypothetical protein